MQTNVSAKPAQFSTRSFLHADGGIADMSDEIQQEILTGLINRTSPGSLDKLDFHRSFLTES